MGYEGLCDVEANGEKEGFEGVEREGEYERETMVRRRKSEKREMAGSGGRTGGVRDARERGWQNGERVDRLGRSPIVTGRSWFGRNWEVRGRGGEAATVLRKREKNREMRD
ncbi:hypothetical protein HAX54_037774 [Datura stramonium]|uniref:Uncharacterized protein n=1 Tax=Datura stramonium TaxID=4076 RepID=A0ABS8SIB8_DATST|nr:hypothetical protein [Datura stramonium]